MAGHVEYLLTFTFHLDPIQAPMLGLAQKMYDVKHVATDGTKDSLVEAVNRESQPYIAYPNGLPKTGITLRKDPSAMEGADMIDTDRIFIMNNLIRAITVTTKRMTGETPQVDLDGILSTLDGKEVKPQ